MATRPGKHNGGFRKGRLAAALAGAFVLLCLTLFVTHLVYTRFFAPEQPENPAAGQGVLTAATAGAAEQHETTTRPDSAEAAPVIPPTTRPAAARPEDLPGGAEAGASEQTPIDPTAPEQTEAPQPDPDGLDPSGLETGQPIVPYTIVPQTTVPSADPADPNTPTPGAHGLYSQAALLIHLSSGAELYALEADTRIYPASLAKMMTALVALERSANLDGPVTITADMLAGLSDAGASTAGFLEGETVPLRDLLYGLMLPSGADAANAVAVHTAGSINAFVALMNQKAAEIGMADTRFANTHGLHDDRLYSTCRDLAVLLRHALQNADFRKIFTTGVYTTAATPEHPDSMKLSNTMAAAFGENPLDNGVVLGSKTGFTSIAGQCLASLASIGGQEYILITTGAGNAGYNTQRYNMLDALNLYGQIGG